MKILCDICNLQYEELYDESILMYENGCKMICHECCKKTYKSMENKNQPERLNPEDAKSVCDSPNSEHK